MKKTLSIILALTMLLCTLSCLSFSAFANDEDLKASGKCGKSATYTFDANSGELVISGKGYLDTNAFMCSTKIKKVKVKNGITSVGLDTFYNCAGLTEVELAKSVKIIGQDAFSGSLNLKSLRSAAMKMKIAPHSNAIPRCAVIYANAGSDLETYAKEYGRSFVDIKTGKKTEYVVTNYDWLKAIPKSIKPNEPTNTDASYSWFSGEFSSYQPYAFHTEYTNDPRYKLLIQLAEELKSGKKTDLEILRSDLEWFKENFNYQYFSNYGNTFPQIYAIYEDKYGNCEACTNFLNYLLYLQNIPAVCISTFDHEYSGVLIDGEWWEADATNVTLTHYENDICYKERYTGSHIARTYKADGSGYTEKVIDGEWTAYDPVSVKETHKNQSIYDDIKSIAFTKQGFASYIMESPVHIALGGLYYCDIDCDSDNHRKDYSDFVLEVPDYVNSVYEESLKFWDAKKANKANKKITGNVKANGKYTYMYIWAVLQGFKVTVKGNHYTAIITNEPCEYVCRPKATELDGLKKGKKSFIAKWEKVKGVTGYQIQYAKDAKFTKGKKTITVKGAKNTSKAVKKLKKNTRYYVRVRTYKIVGGKKYYSTRSRYMYVKTK